MQSVKDLNRQTANARCQAATAAAAAAKSEQNSAYMHADELDKAPLQRVRLNDSINWKPQGIFI